MTKLFATAALMVAMTLAACMDVDEDALAGPHQGTAFPGDVVMRIEHTEVIPNLMGDPDIFGRTRNTGITTISLASAASGSATFRRQYVQIISSKNTGNITPTTIATGKKASDVIVLPARTPEDKIGAVKETSFTLTMRPGKTSITIDGHSLTLLAAQTGQIQYTRN